VYSWKFRDQSLSPLTVLPFSAFILAIVLHAIAMKLFPYLGLLDFPQRYGLTRARIPYPTGIIAVIVFLMFLPIVQPLDVRTMGMLSAVAVLGVTCFIDDRTPLPPLLRIIIQLVAALILIGCGIRIEAITNPLPGVLGPDTSIFLTAGWAYAGSIAFTLLWILFTVNALNWFDGITGQVSTLSTIGFLTIGFLSMSERVNQPNIALIAFVLAGLAAACFFFDFPPARVLMGDTGAMFFGFMLGVLTIMSGGKVATAFLVLGVPLIDLVFVVARRLKNKQSPLKGNRIDQHLHHRLLHKGWSPRMIIVLTAGIGTLFGITALFLDTWEKVAAGFILFVLMLGLHRYSRVSRR
jgi:UDP-GlcNAc:undecaprenyl-phosphate GlcNAc-1-phosphate transferase